MNICNFEIHNNCGFYSSSDDVAIKKIDRRSASDVLFVEEKLTYSKLLFVIEGVVKIKINKLFFIFIHHYYFGQVNKK